MAAVATVTALKSATQAWVKVRGVPYLCTVPASAQPVVQNDSVLVELGVSGANYVVARITGPAGNSSSGAHVHPESEVTDLPGDLSSLSTAVGGKEPAIAAGDSTDYWRGDKTWQALNKAAVGLGNVTNTADADKPVSTAQATAIAARARSRGVDSANYAMVGDGITDDTTALNTFLAAAGQSTDPSLLRGTNASYKSTGVLTYAPAAGIKALKLDAENATIAPARTTSTTWHGLVVGADDFENAGWPGEERGYLRGLRIEGNTRTPTFDGSIGLQLKGCTLFDLDHVTVKGGFDIGVQYDENCYGVEMTRCRIGWDANGVNFGIVLKGFTGSGAAAGAGNDQTFRNTWVQGGVSALLIDSSYTNCHWYGGQLSAGWSLGAADDGLGVVMLNTGYTAGPTFSFGSARTGIALFHGADLEASKYLWQFRGYNDHQLNVNGCTLISQFTQGMIGVYKNAAFGNSQVSFEMNEVQGKYTNAALLSIASVGSNGLLYERQTSMQGGDVGGTARAAWWQPSMVEQSAITTGTIVVRRSAINVNGSTLT